MIIKPHTPPITAPAIPPPDMPDLLEVDASDPDDAEIEDDGAGEEIVADPNDRDALGVGVLDAPCGSGRAAPEICSAPSTPQLAFRARTHAFDISPLPPDALTHALNQN